MNIDAFFSLTYGMYIISSGKDGQYNGYVANTAFQVTAEPPQIAIACNKDNLTSGYIEKSGLFSISVLKRDCSPQLLGLFGYTSGRDIDKFANTKFITGQSGVPIVTEDTVAWFECKLVDRMDVGTHIIFVGKIIENELLTHDEPLTYTWYHQVKKGLAPKNAPTYQKSLSVEKTEADGNVQKYQCQVCGHVYDPAEGDPDSGIAPGTPFTDLPEDWCCPVCGAEKKDFEPIIS